MNKYGLLGQHLKNCTTAEVQMTFAEIERVIGAELPPSAYRHRPWWSNNPSNSVMTKVWLDAGFRTEQVDMAGKKLVFKRAVHNGRGSAEEAMTYGFAPAAPEMGSPVSTHPMIGALKGLLKIAPGVDLTEPADPGWGDAAWGDDSRQ
jgi:hypothetical protein